jgi:hypothetical protein
MKSSQLATLKEMAQEVVDLMPSMLSVNGHNQFFCGGDPVEALELLSDIEIATERAIQLNAVIQRIEGRKAAKK